MLPGAIGAIMMLFRAGKGERYVERHTLSQEQLKLIACISMLIDHIGAVFFPKMTLLRVIGRLAFPIYCFLLVEGLHYTHNVRHYLLRLAACAVISEIPYDAALKGGFPCYEANNVMITLLLGALALVTMEQIHNPVLKYLSAVPFLLLASRVFHSDYGQWGVALIVLLGAVRDEPQGRLMQYIVTIIVCVLMPSRKYWILGMQIPIERFAAGAVFPLALYYGRKQSRSKAVQWLFYAFYPAHLAILAILK